MTSDKTITVEFEKYFRADLNNDCAVDELDLAILAEHWLEKAI